MDNKISLAVYRFWNSLEEIIVTTWDTIRDTLMKPAVFSSVLILGAVLLTAYVPLVGLFMLGFLLGVGTGAAALMRELKRDGKYIDSPNSEPKKSSDFSTIGDIPVHGFDKFSEEQRRSFRGGLEESEWDVSHE